MSGEKKRVLTILVIFCFGFISLIAYLSFFQLFNADKVKNNSYNKRLWLNEENVLRGSILDRNDQVLAYSEIGEKSNPRYYKYGRIYSHIIGYSYREYGKAGLELSYNNDLLDIQNKSVIGEIKNLVLPRSVGNNLKLTIDHGLQEKAHSLLKGKKGAIVVMNPKTGEIYSMVSLPDFNVSDLNKDWDNIIEDDEKPLVNRATQGLYPPGSIFKIITASAILDNIDISPDYICKGSTKIDGYKISDYQGKAHGVIDLDQAFAKSCNTYFAEKSLIIGGQSLGEAGDRYMVNKKIDFDLGVSTSTFFYKGNLNDTEIASSAIGQGKVLVTPLNMAMMAASVANEGRMMKPILVKKILNSKGQIIKTFNSGLLSQSVNHVTASRLKEMMLESVRTGTARNARIKNITVAGKTGTAENASGMDHAWFVGFAPYDDPKFAVAVLVEEAASTGGQAAAPIARELIIYGVNNIKD